MFSPSVGWSVCLVVWLDGHFLKGKKSHSHAPINPSLVINRTQIDIVYMYDVLNI